MKRFGAKIGWFLLLCTAAILVELLVYAIIGSHYALRHWWTAGRMGDITLHALLLVAGLMSLIVGYWRGSMWPVVTAQIVLFGARAASIAEADLLMQGLEFPVAMMSAGIFGWIGMRLRTTGWHPRA